MGTLFAAAFGLGLVFNAAPGAVLAETVRQGVHGGYRAALAVQLGSLVGDAGWALLGLASMALALQLEGLRAPVGLAGAVYLLYLSWQSWQAAHTVHVLGRPGPSSVRHALYRGATLSLSNPQNLAYWAAMGSAMGALGVHQPTAADYGVFLAGFLTASLLWCFVCAALVERLFRRAGPVWARFTYRLCATALLVLAVSSLRGLVHAAPAPAPGPARVPLARACAPVCGPGQRGTRDPAFSPGAFHAGAGGTHIQ